MNVNSKGFTGVLKVVRRKLHATKSLRDGMGNARQTLTPSMIPVIVRALSATAVYKSALAVNPFPENFGSFTTNPRLIGISLEGELYWTASVLSLFSTEINAFVQTREMVRRSTMKGEYLAALSELDAFEQRYGVSLWILSNRIQLLQLQDGLKKQKDYLEQTINIQGLNNFAALFAYYFSLRSEENVSYSTLHEEIRPVIKSVEMGDYLRHHVLPGYAEKIPDPQLLISWEEPHPIFDRYETFISALGMFVARNGRTASKHILGPLELLSEIHDTELIYLRNIIQNGIGNSISDDAIDLYDSYLCGALKPSFESFFKYPEISARALAWTGRDVHSDDLAGEMAMCMKAILLGEDGYKIASTRLQKIGLIAGDRRRASAIAYFLRRADNRTAMQDPSIPGATDRTTLPLGPWAIDELSEAEREVEFSLIASRFPNSTFVHLVHTKLLDVDVALTTLQALSLPADRKALISGKLLFDRNQHDRAREYLHAATKNARNLATVEAKRYLVLSLLKTGEVKAAIELVSDEFLNHGSAYRLFPVAELLTLALKERSLYSSVHVAIVLSIAARFVNPHWERELSDIFENSLSEQGVSRPSEMFPKSISWSSQELTYFFRYIATLRVLDDLIDFKSMEEVEEERIKICQFLIGFDAENSEVYASEIRSITREATIFRTLNTVEASKIYVDENGIKGVVTETLSEVYSRFRILANSPDLSYQADKISKRLSQLWQKVPLDLREYHPAQSERNGLLDSMLTIFLMEFSVNPAYGLDTHVSTTIRHGAIEGHIRTPLVAFDLLCGKADGRYVVAPRWIGMFGVDAGLDEIATILTRLTIRVEEQILRCNEMLRVRNETDCPNSLFNFYMTEESRGAFRDTVDASESYDEVVAKLFKLAWSLVANSLEAIRNELLVSVGDEINAAIDSAIVSISSWDSNTASDLRDALTRSKTRFQSDLELTKNWFRLPRDQIREDFDIDIAVDVALQQIRHCYIRNCISAKTLISLKDKFSGQHLDGLVEIMFILLQNVIRHSGYQPHDICEVAISVSELSNEVTISVVNQVAVSIDITKVKSNAELAVSQYNYDSAMRRAREEGGSGLSKVWRIAQYDLQCTHALEVDIREQKRTFEVRMTLGGLR